MNTNLYQNKFRTGTLHHSNNGVAVCSTKIELSDYVMATLDSNNNATYIFGHNANHAVCKNCAKKIQIKIQ